MRFVRPCTSHISFTALDFSGLQFASPKMTRSSYDCNNSNFQIQKMFIASSTLITHKIQSHIFATMRDDEAELIGPSMGSKQVYKLI